MSAPITEIKLCGQCGKPDNHPVCCLSAPALALPGDGTFMYQVKVAQNPKDNTTIVSVIKITHTTDSSPRIEETIGSGTVSMVYAPAGSAQPMYEAAAKQIVKEYEYKQNSMTNSLLGASPSITKETWDKLSQMQQAENDLMNSQLDMMKIKFKPTMINPYPCVVCGKPSGTLSNDDSKDNLCWSCYAAEESPKTVENPFAADEAELMAAIQEANPIVPFLQAKLNAKKQSYQSNQIEMQKKVSKTYISGSAALVQKLKQAKAIDNPNTVADTSDKLKTYYKAKFIENLKANTPLGKFGGLISSEDYDEEETPVFSNETDQDMKFIQRIGVLSNVNVSLQGKRIGYLRRTLYRLICDTCGKEQPLDTSVATTRNINDPGLVEFCKKHRHLVEAPISNDVGRKFRDEL